jgi:CHAD domain-containing protein
MAVGPVPARPLGVILSPDDGAALAARVVVRFHLRAFARQEQLARAGDVEGVHELRVATRRLRAALRFFAPVLPARFVENAGREIQWLASTIGAVRDLDVLGQLVTARAPRLDPDVRSPLGPLAIYIHDRRAAAHAALVAALDSARCRRLLDRLAAFAESMPPRRSQETLGEVAPSLLRPLLRAVLSAGRSIGENPQPEALHRLRVRGKRLRYALETLRGLGGKNVGKMLRRLVALQDLIGDHQDAFTAMERLRAYGETAEVPPATLLSVGALVEGFGRRARKLRRRFPETWRRLDRSRLRTGLQSELARRRSRRRPLPPRLRATGS